jgi:hypothetical protein
MGLALLILFVASAAIAVLLGVYGLGALLGRWDRRKPFDAPTIAAPVPRPILRPPPRRGPTTIDRSPVRAAVTPPAPPAVMVVPPTPAPPALPRFQPARPGVIAAPPPLPQPQSRLARGSMPPVEAPEQDTPRLVPSRTGARFSVVRSTRR